MTVEFADFYEATSPRTLRYAYGLTGDLAQAQDVTQEAYTRAWERWPKVRRYDDAEAWIRLVISRLAHDWWRHLRVRRTTALPEPQPLPGPGDDTMVLVAALRQLPAAQRKALVLHHMLDLSVGQIAAETGAPENTVKSWLLRGRDSMADILRAELDGVRRPTAAEVADRGRRRRRTRAIVSAAAAAVAVVLVAVLAVAFTGRGRAMPQPATSPSTATPKSFESLTTVGSLPVPAATRGSALIAGGDRAYSLAVHESRLTVTAIGLADGRAPWPAVTLPGEFSRLGRDQLVTGEAIVVTGEPVVASGGVAPGQMVFALDPATGSLLWQWHQLPLTGTLIPYAHALVASGNPFGTVTVLDLRTGAERQHLGGQEADAVAMTWTDPAGPATTGARQAIPREALYVRDAATNTLGEYDVATGAATGRSWPGMPPLVKMVAADGDVYFADDHLIMDLHLADGRMTTLFDDKTGHNTGGTFPMVPCGGGACVLRHAGDPDATLVAVRAGQVRWTRPFPQAGTVQTIGDRIAVRIPMAEETVLLDAGGTEVLRLPHAVVYPVDDANALVVQGTRTPSAPQPATVSGLDPRSLRTTVLGTVPPPNALAASGNFVVTAAATTLTVYRFAR